MYLLFFSFLWSIFYRQNKKEFHFFFLNFTLFVYLSINLSYEFLSKRKGSPGIKFFFVDPNFIVYCYFFSFFFIFLFFSAIWFSIYNSILIYTITNKIEFSFWSYFTALFVYLFSWAYLFRDRDLSSSFLFKISPEYANTWDFSVYFFNFFGTFFDVYYYCLLFFFFFSWFVSKIYSSFFQKAYFWFFRVCFAGFLRYLFSGESFFYDSVSFFFGRISFEISIFFFNLFWIRKAYKALFFNSKNFSFILYTRYLIQFYF